MTELLITLLLQTSIEGINIYEYLRIIRFKYNR